MIHMSRFNEILYSRGGVPPNRIIEPPDVEKIFNKMNKKVSYTKFDKYMIKEFKKYGAII